jgi:hypothetical protein
VFRNSALRKPVEPTWTPPARTLTDAAAVDLATMRLLLHQHLDELRRRGVGDEVLRPIEAELRRFDETVDQLVDRL